MLIKNKGWNEQFSQFFEDPSREGLRDLLQNHFGESNSFDFKENWPPALSKIARHILGFANSGGGCLVMGIKEKDDNTFDPVGVDKLLDKADIQKGIQKFIPPQIEYEILNFSYDSSEYPKIVGKKFQVIFVEDIPGYIPFVSKSDGTGIEENAIYVRRGTNTVKANYEELQKVLNRRVETEYFSQREFDLDQHLAELRILYDQIPRYISLGAALASSGVTGMKNNRYPKEDFETFVKKIIGEKKAIIQEIALDR